eukprot:1807512-Alexandrium_andersonii.AAC.1
MANGGTPRPPRPNAPRSPAPFLIQVRQPTLEASGLSDPLPRTVVRRRDGVLLKEDRAFHSNLARSGGERGDIGDTHASNATTADPLWSLAALAKGLHVRQMPRNEVLILISTHAAP